MSWNADLALLVDTRVDELGPTGRTAAFDDIGQREIGAWQVGANVVLFAPSMAATATVKTYAGRLARQLYLVSLVGTVDTYVIEAIGPIDRLHVLVEDQVADHRGAPLAAERLLGDYESDSETAHFAVFSELAGVDFWALAQEPAIIVGGRQGGFGSSLLRRR